MRSKLCALAAVGLLGLAACGGGTTEGGTDESSGGNSSSADGGSGPITVQDSRGTVELPGVAEKVVAIEWSYAEDLVSLGVTPVGIADKQNYAKWVSAVPLPEASVDVGTRQEPSIEKIRALDPDLIVTDKGRSPANLDKLEAIAPTLVFDPTRDDMSMLEQLRHSFQQLAKATGTQDKGEQVLAALEQRIADGKQKLAEAGMAGKPVALAQGYTWKNAPTMRMFGPPSLAGQIIDKLGLKNAWNGKPDEWGFTTIGVEGLTSVSKADFMYIAPDDDNIYTGSLADNAIWTNLDFVKTDRVHKLDPGTWTFGGPKSTEQIVDEIVKALT